MVMNPGTIKKLNLLDFDQQALRGFFESLEEKSFRAQQLINWVHQRGIDDFNAMTNVSKSLRLRLESIAEIRPPKVVMTQTSVDGTYKWLLELDRPEGKSGPSNRIEMVFIPEPGRGTLCISSQVGCSLDCTFCSTAQQGFNRNLTTGEIIGQLWLARKLLSAHGLTGAITNVVLMGMGEPLLNFNNVVPALKLMMDDQAYGLSKRRVTLSTAGVVPMIDRLRAETDVSLAVSLHAPDNALRDKLVPINKKFPLEELMPACRRYLDKQNKRRITFEYVMLDNINDQPQHARALAALLKDIPSKINLIPFNPFPNTVYKRSPDKVIERFSMYLQKQGYVATVRKTRGDDIDAACGQLVGNVQDRSGRQIRFERRYANA